MMMPPALNQWPLFGQEPLPQHLRNRQGKGGSEASEDGLGGAVGKDSELHRNSECVVINVAICGYKMLK